MDPTFRLCAKAMHSVVVLFIKADIDQCKDIGKRGTLIKKSK